MSDDLNPFMKIHDNWALDVYIITSITTSSILIIAYVVTLVKTWFGTRYNLIVFLIVLLILSNIGAVGKSTILYLGV